MNRRAPVILLLLFVTAVAGARPQTDERPKSVVLLGRSAQKNPFHLKPEHQMEDLWDGFMLVKQANSGDPVAQHQLGLRYLTGQGFPRDTVTAALWIRRAAEQNLMTARYNYGILLNGGLGVGWNPYEAYRNFRYAAEHGLMEGQFVYGLLMTDNLAVPRNYHEAYRWIRMAADSGYAPAQEVIAEFRKRGISTGDTSGAAGERAPRSQAPPVQTKSVVQPVFLDFTADSLPVPDEKTLIREVLEEDSSYLRNSLTAGHGEKPDSLTRESLLASAETGNPEALTVVGLLYQEGRGIRKNLIEATVCYLRAIRLNSPRAPQLLWKMIQHDEYYPLLKARIQENDPAAEYAWAGLARYELDHQLLESQALELLRRAAGQNYTQALLELGLCYYTGRWTGKNRDSALGYFRLAARSGDREALLRLAAVSIFTSAVPDSLSLATVWDALTHGSVLAQEVLGYCYQHGIGVPKSKPEAVQYYRKAAQRGSVAAYNALRGFYDEIRPGDPEFQIQD